jgi:hypothetical protein
MAVGSCIATVRCQILDTHPSNQMGRDSFGIDHGFICRHVEIQVLLMNPSEGAQVGTERRSRPFTEVTVDLASTVPIIIPGPLVDTMADGGMSGMGTVITLPFIRVQDRARPRDILGDQISTGAPIRAIAHPQTLLACLA